MACLFCLKSLSSEKDLRNEEEPLTSEGGQEKVPLMTSKKDDPTKNLEAFNCLCRLLKVDWMKIKEEKDCVSGTGDKKIGDDKNRMTFDTKKPLPLCCSCEKIYQDVHKLYQEIMELEGIMMKKVKVIRETIETTENGGGGGGGTLVGLKLIEFRKKVLESTINNQSLLETIPNQPMVLGEKEKLNVKVEVLDNEEDEDKEEADLLENFKIEVQLEEKLEEGATHELVEEEVHSPTSSSSSTRTRSQRRKSSNKRIIIKKTFEKAKPNSPSKIRESEKQLKSKSDTQDSPRKSTTTTSVPGGRNVKTKLQLVTETTPKIHIDCFTCCYCGLRFNHTGTLSKHKKRHEPRTLKCPSCPKMFTLDSDVKRHVKLVHKKK